MKRNYSERLIRETLAFAAEESVTAASKKFEVPRTTINSWRHRYGCKPEPASSPTTKQKSDSRDLEIAGLKAQVARLQDAVAPETPEAMWTSMEAKTKKSIKKLHEQSVYDIDLTDSSNPVAVTFTSDQHIGSKYCDMRRMREDAELIRDTDGMHAVLGGDGVDNHILIRQAMIASESDPTKQYQMFEYYLSIMADRIRMMITGNHDAWTGKVAGVDVLAMIAEKTGLAYRRHEVLIRAKVGSQVYRILVRHATRYNSALNALHGLKRQWDLGNHDFDIGVAGHVHTAALEKFTRHRIDRWAALAGSYQLTSDYSSYGGFPDSAPTCPTFVLYPDRRHIVGFDSLRDGATYLGAVRGS